jgi:hypothetical protein
MTSPVNVGDILGGKYQVERVLGVGGMGVVVSAKHLHLGERVTAKSEFNLSNSSGNCNAATTVCNPAGLTQRSSAVGKGNIGTGVFVAGAVVAAGGIVIWATAPSRAASVQVGVGPTGGSLRGAF